MGHPQEPLPDARRPDRPCASRDRRVRARHQALRATARPRPGRPGAVKDLSLTVPAGRICVLVGPSGCGKTTSLKMVNRLIEPTSGRILIDGVDIATIDSIELRRGIGYVIQQVGLFPHQTIADNVATVPRLLGWPAARLRERADELLDLVGLDPATLSRPLPGQLSGGERQRVGVARALAADPPIMLMDEPFGAVDPIVRERLQNELLRLQDELAKTILFVTHDIDEAIKMGDLVVVIQVGGIVAQSDRRRSCSPSPRPSSWPGSSGADRGLKRLSLFRVGDIAADAGRHGARRRQRRRRSARGRRASAVAVGAARRRRGPAHRLAPTATTSRPTGAVDRPTGDREVAVPRPPDDAQGRDLDAARRGGPRRRRRGPDRRAAGPAPARRRSRRGMRDREVRTMDATERAAAASPRSGAARRDRDRAAEAA